VLRAPFVFVRLFKEREESHYEYNTVGTAVLTVGPYGGRLSIVKIQLEFEKKKNHDFSFSSSRVTQKKL
jgi:hypothetical protein